VLDALKAAGCAQLFTDKVSGAAKTKDGLDGALRHAREGDVLVVLKLDRLGRTVKGLVELVEGLQARGVCSSKALPTASTHQQLQDGSSSM
jgi:DNA invertase Pin-like site-specific DNA recombinase